jgi:hypothetical protein
MQQRKHAVCVLSLVVAITCTVLQFDIARANSTLFVAPDSQVTYSRALFKHWIDEDRDGCDTRAEVLLEEATIKPKIGKKCTLSGGSWLSPYDNKVQNKASSLDIDHLVPLAEAWRSGAWKWTSTQRQAFANDLNNKEALVAVTLSLNRSKGDKDVAEWLPPVNQCTYARDWIVVKLTYGLTVDSAEGAKLEQLISSCGITGVTIQTRSSGTSSSTPTPTPIATASSTSSPAATKFKMPFILGDGKLGVAKSKWKTYGFVNPPIIVQRPSGLKEYSCKPITDDDWISDVSPKWDTLVDINTEVTITTSCTLDLQSTKSPTPAASSSPSSNSTPTTTVSSSPTPTPTPSTSSPTPTPTPSTSSPTPTPTNSSPTNSWPPDSTAKCKDGTYSYSKTRSGTCSGHGGVAQWRNP